MKGAASWGAWTWIGKHIFSCSAFEFANTAGQGHNSVPLKTLPSLITELGQRSHTLLVTVQEQTGNELETGSAYNLYGPVCNPAASS